VVYTLSGLLCGGLMSAGGGGCWSVGLRVYHVGVTSMEEP
jgi:hypothetical protein